MTPRPMDHSGSLPRALRRCSLTSRIVIAGTMACAVPTSWWALSPLTPSEIVVPKPVEPDGRPIPQPAATPLNLSAFDAVLWTSPPTPLPPAPPPSPAPPLRLQLVGILVAPTDEGGPRVVLYDPAADRLHILAQGEAIDRYVVSALSQTTVDLTDAHRVHHLSLGNDGTGK